MKRQSILVWFVVMTAGTSVYSADWQMDWVGGENIPISWDWSIYTSHFKPSSQPPGTVPFSGPNGVFSNSCWAAYYLRGTPTITIDENQKTIELRLGPPIPDGCIYLWDPVCGLNGWFGPLSDGDWLFFSNRIGSFHLDFHVGPPHSALTILNPNGNESLLGGSTYTIMWDDSRSESCVGNYLLSYSTDNGSSWFPVDSNPVSNICSYDWLIPLIISNQCLIRITDADDPNMGDISDDSFRISFCPFSILGDWNGDCYVDFGDFSIIAAGWNVNGGKDINNLAGFVQSWLDCANPYDPSCNIGRATCDYPLNGSVIIGERYPFPPARPTHIFTTLVFIPGPNAVKHVGYFSDNYADVFNRVQDANMGPPPYPGTPGYETTYYVGMPLIGPATDTLVRGTKYYWTVDETDALGNTFAGVIWEFTIQGFYAYEPDPPNEATFVETDVLLSWQPAYDADSHDIYMGTSWEDVNNAVFDLFHPPPEFMGNEWRDPNYQASGLPFETRIYWRIDEVDGNRIIEIPTIYKGRVWEFTTTPPALYNGDTINFKDYAIPSNYRQKTGPNLP